MKSHNYSIDYIRALACLMVLLLHISAVYIVDGKGLNWVIGNIIDSSTRVSVPLFLMISGYIFLGDKTPNIKNYLKIIFSLVFYSGIGLLVYFISSMVFNQKPKYTFFSEPSFYHLWYLYIILSIYFLSSIIKTRAIKSHILFFVFIIFFICFNPKSNDLFILLNINFENYFQIKGYYFYYVLYALFGSLIGKLNFETTSNKFRIFLLVMYFLSSITIAILTHYSAPKLIYYAYDGPLVAIGAMSLFTLFISLQSHLSEIKLINEISKNSLAIYAIHAFILLPIQELYPYTNLNPFFAIPLIFMIVLILSYGFALLIKKFDKLNLIS